MKQILILVTLILSFGTASSAEIWKCQKTGEQAAAYTDTPTGGEGINCEKVETIRFTKTGDKAARSASAPARSYSAPPPHITTKTKGKMNIVRSRAPGQKKQSSSGKGGKGGNHPSGVNSK